MVLILYFSLVLSNPVEVSYTRDSTNSMNIGNIATVETWKPLDKDADPSSAYTTWLKITANDSLPPGEYCIDFNIASYKEAYFMEGGVTKVVKNGSSLLPSERSVPEHSRYLCFVFSESNREVFVKIPPIIGSGESFPSFTLERKADIEEKFTFNTRVSFVITGGMLVIILCAFTVFFFLRDLVSLLFGVYLTCFYLMANKTFLSYMLGDEFPFLMTNSYVNQLYFILTPVSFLLFSYFFFQSTSQRGRSRKLFLYSLLASLACFATMFNGDLVLNSTLILWYNLYVLVIVTAYSWYAYRRRKFGPALYFLIGLSVPLFVAILIVIHNTGIMFINGLSLMADSSVLLLSFILAIGVVQRFKIVSDERAIIERQAHALEEMNAMKDRLLAVLSHDLRGPVGNLSSILSLFSEKQISNEEFQKLSVTLKTQVESSYHVLEEVLQWVKSQREGIVPNPVKFDVMMLIYDVVAHTGGLADSKQITVKVNGPEAIDVLADRDHVNVVIRNLLGNALKFSPLDETVDIRVVKENGFVRVSVIDYGKGISTEDIARILNREKVKGTQGTRGEKGTGLGLLLCQEFIQYNHGTFTINSIPGRGTTVSFTIRQ